MGTYVYSLRKKHVEAQLDGIYPVDVVAFQYAYKDSNVSYDSHFYGSWCRRVARVERQAKEAQTHYFDRARKEHGDTMHNFYFAMGGLEDGNTVYEIFQWLPTTGTDNGVTHTGNGPCQNIGRLYKVGRGQWIISEDCPEHRWDETCQLSDLTPVYQCERCDHIKEN